MLIFREKDSFQDDSLLVVDQGEHSVRMAICRKKGEKCFMDDVKVYEYRKVRMEERIQESIQEASLFGVRNVAWTFDPSFLKTRVVAHSIKRPHVQTRIQKKEQEALEKKIFQEAEEKAKESIASQTGILGDEFLCLKKKVLGIRIDGYEVSDVKGFSGESIEFRFIFTFLQEKARFFLAKSLLSSTMKLQSIGGELSSLENICRSRGFQEVLYVDIGDRSTRFFLFSFGAMICSGEFNRGGDVYTCILEQSLGMNRGSAVELKHRYSTKQQNDISEGVRKKLKELFIPESIAWRQELSRHLAIEGRSIPSKVFLFGGGSLMPELQEIFEDQSFLLPRDVISHSSSSPQFTTLALCANFTILIKEQGS